MAKRTVYVVQKAGLEYNDEYYYIPESGGGEAVEAYSTKEKALAARPKYLEELQKELLYGFLDEAGGDVEKAKKAYEEYAGHFPSDDELVSITELVVKDEDIIDARPKAPSKKTSVKAQYESASKQIAELKKQAQGIAREVLLEEFKTLFKKHPEALEVRWSQYTPYFNDGDSCEFGVNDVYVKFVDSPEDGGDYGDGFEDSYGDDEVKSHIIHEFGKVVNSIDKDSMEDMFGDHVQVTINNKLNVDVEEHEHD